MKVRSAKWTEVSNRNKTGRKATSFRWHRRGTTAVLAGALIAASAFGIFPTTRGGVLGPQIAAAQNFSQRTIQGKVYEGDTAVAGATVFLKNLKTRNVKSFTSTPDGTFRFAQVGMVDDYEVWAERGPKKSAIKTVSSFDSRKQVEYELKLK